ncbi:MAG: sulfoxide reductase heme-binding subunit YedZ [Rhodocyclaceae bacterium]|nr:sulfoxide reductase heme-binding subunit YedZ [Rhodocyclaceae bacterium]
MPHAARSTPSPLQLSIIKGLLFVTCLVPLLQLILAWRADDLGANPIEAVSHATGDWTLRFLLITLAVTPLRRLTGLHWLLRLRRMLGLFAFAYGVTHLLAYVGLDQFFDWTAIAMDILKRPYITVGFAALVLMTPLALTSNAFMIRRLGGRRWQSLHRSIYAIALLGVLHFWWLVKADYLEPLIYSAVLAGLLGIRAWWRNQERHRQLRTPPGAPPRGPSGRRVIPIASR